MTNDELAERAHQDQMAEEQYETLLRARGHPFQSKYDDPVLACSGRCATCNETCDLHDYQGSRWEVAEWMSP